MADVFSQKRFAGGIADSLKENANNQVFDSFYFSRALDYRTDPQSLTLLPGAVKESGGTVTDLIKWGDINPNTLINYFYGDTGNIYARSTSSTWTNLFTEPNAHGNGMAYFAGDEYLYFAADATIGRYGPLSGTPQFSADFLGAQGGIPLNTASVTFASASSQYAHAADSASLSQTGDITLETFFKATSLPAVGSSMTLIGKWDESGATRSYIMDLYGISGYFGDGSDGSLTISSPTTEAPIDSVCTGTSGSVSLTATNASFAVGQVILIHQSQGTSAGQWERGVIQGYTAGTITLGTPLIGTYTTGAQVRVLKQYTTVTINSTYTSKLWTGSVGGILSFIYTGTLSGAGTITASSRGYNLGGAGGTQTASQGEGTGGLGSVAQSPNGNGGGGSQDAGNASPAGGSNGTYGVAGSGTLQHGIYGDLSGSADLTTMTFGGQGGGASTNNVGAGGTGGFGGGIIFCSGVTQSFTGAITADGQGGSTQNGYGGGGGAGGSILMKAQVATLGSNLISAVGSSGGGGGPGAGKGGDGRIHLDYLTSYTGTTTPTLDATQDGTLVTTASTQARLGISSNGSSFEYLTKTIPTLTTGLWNRLSISWQATTSTATFYLNAVSLGTTTGTKNAISDNASLLYVAANKNASTIANYFNGELNDMRVWGTVQTAAQIFTNNTTQISPSSGGLKAYYKFNSAYTDATANANTLTAVNTPVFTSDVPFPSPTTRLDIDQSYTVTGHTYTLLTSLSEASVDQLPFTPQVDPQKSMAFNISAKGTGNWTVTIHDQQNNVIATQTISNANLVTSGYQEFIYPSPWVRVNGRTYHAHLTSTVGDGTVVTSTASDFSTGDFYTYFAFLITDSAFHPMIQFQYQPLGGTLSQAIIIGNDNYLAVWDGANYDPNFIFFPPQWHVRCFGFWREFLAIGMWRGGNIYDFDQGRIYFWDGIAPTFNFFVDVPEGQVNALKGIDADLYLFAGYRGQLLVYQGGGSQTNGGSRSTKLKRIPLLSPADYTEVFPGAMTMWRSLLHFGAVANSNSTTIERGVYSWGTLFPFYPETLSYDYVISTGNTGSSVSIGMTYPAGQNLLVSWRDGIACGVDVVNFNNPPASYGELQLLVRDDGSIWHQGSQFQARVDFLQLESGQSIAAKIKLNRADSFITGPLYSTVEGQTFTKVQVPSGRANEYMIGVDVYATGTTSPTIQALSIQHDALETEKVF